MSSMTSEPLGGAQLQDPRARGEHHGAVAGGAAAVVGGRDLGSPRPRRPRAPVAGQGGSPLEELGIGS